MNLATDFISLFFPRSCFICGNSLFKNEEVACTRCLLHLPETHFHREPENPVFQIFRGRIHIESAASFYYYKKGGSVQQLIHRMKYQGHREIGIYLGKLYGQKLKEEPRFSSVDTIIPIPLHRKKEKKRGFNQAEMIAIGLAESMKKELDTKSVIRVVASSTQTKKSRYKRWENVSEIFRLTDSKALENIHVLLVDDVITTGATMEACLLRLQTAPGIKLSVASIATAIL